MALVIVTWYWGSKYDMSYVNKLAAGLSRNHPRGFRFLVAKPCEQDTYLTEIPGCFARLRMFSRQWQEFYGIAEGDRVVCLDLDLVITAPIGGLLDRNEPFVIFQGANVSNPCPYNGSIFQFTAGLYTHVWSDFSLEAARAMPFYEFPDDQGWLAAKLPGAAGWVCGVRSGVWAFGKKQWPRENFLPPGAKIVTFPGRRDPSQFTNLPWMKQHWR